MKWVLCAGLGLLLGCGTAETDRPGESDDDNLKPTGSVGVIEGALYSDLTHADGRVYGCTVAHGLRIAEVGEGGALGTVTEGASLPAGPGCRTITAAPDGALFAGGESEGGGSWIANIDGSVLATVDDGLVETLAATQTHVFAALGKAGIAILGRNDGELAVIGELAEGFDQALGVCVWGSRLLVADGIEGVAVVDWSDPAAPLIESRFDTPGTARRVAMLDDQVVVADVAGGIGIYAPLTGEVVARWETHGSAVDLDVDSHGTVFVANLEDLSVLDASSPADLRLVATEVVAGSSGAGRVIAVRAHEGVAWAAEWSGLWAFAWDPGIGAPDVQLSRTSLDFGAVTLAKSRAVIVRNLGTALLEIDSVSVDHPDFELDLDAERVPPGGATVLEVDFAPSTLDPVSGTIRIETNDPDEAVLTIPLSGNDPTGLQVGMPWDPDALRRFQRFVTANEVTVPGEYPGKVVFLAWFGTS